MKRSPFLPLILGALPLLAYPFVAIASLMSLAAPTHGHEGFLLLSVARCFQVSSLAYPLVYFGCVIGALVVRKNGREALAFRVSVAPLVFLGAVGLLLGLWVVVE